MTHDEIQLPPLPEPEATLRDFGPAYQASHLEVFARAAILVDRANRATLSPQGDAPTLPAMDADLVEILGRPNFACRDIANVLRRGGREIPNKSEHEQAHTLHFLLGFKLRHGADWWTHARADLQRVLDAARAPATEMGK